MSRIREFREIEFHQACAIARVVLLRDPSMTNFDWHEAVKETCVKQGYQPPVGDMLTRACAAVERAVMQTMGPRPVKEPGAAPEVPKLAPPPLTPAEWSAFAATVRNIAARSAAVTPANVSPMPRAAVFHLSEHAALDQFYAEAETDRCGALKRFAEVAIERESGWNHAAVRASSQQHKLYAPCCFACRADGRAIEWHHIIQIQHGGSNLLRNRVALCAPCHSDIHPWLPKVARVAKGGWTDLAGIAVAAEVLIRQSLDKKNGTA